jgi:5-methyltetrahydropteroyltriglutamate--homocysteine methyltransferase
MKPPFRADQVGSLLRPATLAAARAQHARAELPDDALRAQEDAAIRTLIARQQDIGLRAVTDGELRRSWWHLDFIRQLNGVTLVENTDPTFGGVSGQPPIATVTGRIHYARPIMVEDFRFLQSATDRVAKFTIPSPSMLHFRSGRAGISRQHYPDIDAFWSDAAEAWRAAIAAFHAAGCRYLQLDDISFAYLCDERYRQAARSHGDDPDQLPARYARTINEALRDRPADLTVTMHTCHGNFRSTSAARGSYERVVDALFSTVVDGYFMEFDRSDWGSFEALQRLPPDKRVVLGLVTTKVRTMEQRDELLRRIEAASRIVPLERLCLSPQCGFASTYQGNDISDSDQWRKLELVVSVAREVWPDA